MEEATQRSVFGSKESSVDYRAWPMYLLAFIRLFFISIFERAFSNYLLFDLYIDESTFGFITSAGAIAYIFAPILGQLATKKLGIRNALIITSISTPILLGAHMIFFAPWYLVLIRVLNGLMLGLYWPNCLALLSKWQRVSPVEKANKNFKHFNYSWNFGFMAGLLVGIFIAFFLSDYIIMVISWTISFALIPISFFLKKEPKIEDNGVDVIVHLDDRLSEVESEEFMKNHAKTPMIVFPILFSWLGMLFWTTTKSIFIFSYPIFVRSFGLTETYLTYLIQLIVQVGQVIGLTWISGMKPHRRKTSVLISLVTLGLIAFLMLIFQDLLGISILSGCIGLFIGFIHGTSLKIMLDHNAAKNTHKYSTINEILIGIGFGITPIIAGYVAEVQIYFLFLFIVIYGITVFFILLYLSRNIKKDKSNIMN